MDVSLPVMMGGALLIGIVLLLFFRRGGAGRHDPLEGRTRHSLEGRPRNLGQAPPAAAPRSLSGRARSHGSAIDGHNPARAPSSTGALSPEAEAEVRLLLTSGKKIAAIKVVRESTGMGLKEAKEFVEAMER